MKNINDIKKVKNKPPNITFIEFLNIDKTDVTLKFFILIVIV